MHENWSSRNPMDFLFGNGNRTNSMMVEVLSMELEEMWEIEQLLEKDERQVERIVYDQLMALNDVKVTLDEFQMMDVMLFVHYSYDLMKHMLMLCQWLLLMLMLMLTRELLWTVEIILVLLFILANVSSSDNCLIGYRDRIDSDGYDEWIKSFDKRNFDNLFFPIRSNSSSSLKSAVNGLFTGPSDDIGCGFGDFISSGREFGVGDDDTGFNRNRISTKGRAEEFFFEFDWTGRVTGDATDVDVVVVVVVVVIDVGRTIKSVGGFIWSISLKSRFPRLANGSSKHVVNTRWWIIDICDWAFCCWICAALKFVVGALNAVWLGFVLPNGVEKLNGDVPVVPVVVGLELAPKPLNGCGLKSDEVDDVGAVEPNRFGVGFVEGNENGDAVEVAVCVPKPPNIGAVLVDDAVGAPNIFVVVDDAAGTPKPVNAGVVVPPPNAGAAVLVVVPNIFVVPCWAPNGLVMDGAAVVVAYSVFHSVE